MLSFKRSTALSHWSRMERRMDMKIYNDLKDENSNIE